MGTETVRFTSFLPRLPNVTRLGLRGRIAAGFAAILILAVGMAGFAIFNALGLNRDFADYRAIANETQSAETLTADFTRMLVLARDELATPDEERRAAIADMSHRVRRECEARSWMRWRPHLPMSAARCSPASS